MTTPIDITPDNIRSLFEDAVESVGRGIEQIVDGFNNLVDNVWSKRWILGGAVMLWIKHKLDEASEGLSTIIAKGVSLIEHSTPVVSLILTSFSWLTSVQVPTSGMAASATTKRDGLIYWKGEAAEAYSTKISFQGAAASDTATKADFISNWLLDIARQNVAYAVTLGEYVATIAGAVTQAAIDAASVFGIIEAINAVASAAGDLVATAVTQLFEIANRVVALLDNARDAKATINNIEKFPGRPSATWPQAVNV